MVFQRHLEISTVNGTWTASKVQANYTMMVLKALLNYASNQYSGKGGQLLIPVNPTLVLSQNRSWHRIQPRQGVIPDSKFPAWYKSVLALRNGKVRDLLLLILFTGLRRTEAMSLTWSNIDFENRTLTIKSETTKNHKEHRLPLSSFVYNLLKQRKAASKDEWVFPGRGRCITRCEEGLDQVRDGSGVQFSLHDLRRSFLTVAERLDTPYYALKKLANHSGGSDVTFGYIIFDVERLRKPMQRISDKLLQLMEAEQPAGKILRMPVSR
jgi:integrase